MALPKNRSPPPSWKDIAIGDIREQQVVKRILRIPEIVEIRYLKPDGQIRLSSSTLSLRDHSRAPITGRHRQSPPGQQHGLSSCAARQVQECSLVREIPLNKGQFPCTEPIIRIYMVPNRWPAIPVGPRMPVDLSRGPDEERTLFGE